MSRYDIEAIRQQVKKRIKSGGKDPTEFKVQKADPGQVIQYRFFILPGLQEGDTICGGKATAKKSMEMFGIPSGAHFIENKRLGCPRVINEEDCEICDYAFDLMKDIPNDTQAGKDERGKIRQNLLPGSYSKVNLYFTNSSVNPENMRGQVLWWDAPKTVVDLWLACLYRDDDGGDPDDPQAYGVFYDEMCAPQFQLEVKQKGKNNSYETSKFLNSKKRPIVVDENGKADMKRITAILEQRHNLFDKMPDVDHDEIRRIAANLAGKPAAKNFDDDEDRNGPKGKAASSTVADERPVQQTKTEKPPRDDDPPPTKKPRSDDDDVPPAKKSQRTDDDDVPPPAKKPQRTDDDDVPPPAKKPQRTDDDDVPPAKKPRSDDDDARPSPAPKKQQQMPLDDDEPKKSPNKQVAGSSEALDSEVDRLLSELDKG